MPSDAKDTSTAEQLKAEGNEHYLKGDYESAHRLYSRAIEEDPTSAIIYDNRAQSSLAMQKFDDAEADAVKAVKFDPKFCKAWARLATARQGLKKYDESKLAWQHAISCLPDDAESPLSPSDKKLKQQCEAGLEALEAVAGTKWSGIDPEAVNSKRLPWDRALAMKQELMNEGRTSLGSSAWVIISAYKDYAEGLETVNLVQRISKGEAGVEGEGNDPEEMGWQGKPNALMNLSNGILRDVRVFHVPGKQWMEKFNEQVRFESIMWQAWTLADAEAVQEEAQDRLKVEGWDRVRPALSTTIRAWILAGYLASGNSRNAETALDYYGRVLSVLEWGRRVWKDVPPKERGTIFDDTFLRGVKRLFLQGLIEAYHEDPGPNSEYNLDDLAAMARDLMSDTATDYARLAAHPNTDYDPGFITSFFINPLGESMSILGFVHMRKALYLRAQGNNEAADEEFAASAAWYAKAGNVLPDDDEKHVYFLAISLEAQLGRGQKLRALLPLCEAIRRDIPKMERIWKFSQMGEGRDAMLKQVLTFEDEYKAKLASGEATLDTVIRMDIADEIVPGKHDQADPPPRPTEEDAEEVRNSQNRGRHVIEDLTLPFPARKPGDILVKAQYAGVNFIDIYYRTGLYPVPSFPFAISGEVAGVIEELPSDEAVLNSEKYKQRGFKKGCKITFMQLSSLAEYVTIPWDGPIFSVPDEISTRIAAAALAQGLSAIVHLTKSYDVKKGDTILIHTVAGGLGLLMCQVAKSRGATVIGTTSTPAKVELAKAHGADHVILYTQENTVQRVAEITDGLGPHAIFDGVGKDTFDIDFEMIRCNGTLVSLGNSSGAVPPFSPLRLSEKNVRLLYPSLFNYLVTLEQQSYWGTELWRLVAAGDLKINIYQDYPFTAEGVRSAQVDLTSGKTVGKLLIKVADGMDSQT